MAHIGFILAKPKTSYADRDIGEPGWALSFTANLSTAYRQHVSLKTGEKISDIEITVFFEDANAKAPYYEGHDKGTLSYHQGREGSQGSLPAIVVTVRLPGKELQRLMATMAGGLPLRGISIDVPGVQYGWAPDGSEKDWDNEERPRLPLAGFNLSFGEPEEEELVPDLPEIAIETDGKILVELRQIRSSLAWMTGILVALVVLILLRG